MNDRCQRCDAEGIEITDDVPDLVRDRYLVVCVDCKDALNAWQARMELQGGFS